MHPLTLENDALKIQVWPGYGSKVASVIDKADRFDLLFSYPRELPTSPHYDIDYADGWYAGWDECFPGVAKGPYVSHPYEGVQVPDHGEMWGLPTRIVPSNEGIFSRWNGIRFGYHFSRHLRLDGNSLVAQYEVENLAPFDFHFVWALHSLCAMNVPVCFGAPQGSKWRWSHNAKGDAINAPFNWPNLQSGQDISNSTQLPSGEGWKLFSEKPIAAPFEISYPTRNRKLTISYESESNITAYWGIWVNNGGWAGHKHYAVEPTTGRYDRIDESVRDRSAGTVAPLATVKWTVRWTVG